jgi:hypothetical protein
MNPKELSDGLQVCASGGNSPSKTTNDALKTSDPVSAGPTVVFHDLVSGLGLDRLKKQADDEQKRLALLDSMKKQAEDVGTSASWRTEQTSPWFQKQNEERRQRAEEERKRAEQERRQRPEEEQIRATRHFRTSDPVSPGPTVVFHDLDPGVALDRLKKQADDEERKRAEQERRQRPEEERIRATRHFKTSDPVSPGPTVIFHDLDPGVALNRLKKQADEEERIRAEEERKRAEQERRQRAEEERIRAEEERKRAEQERRQRAEEERIRAEEERKRIEVELQFGSFLTKHHYLVEKFFEIAERKVSVLDDYGEENWDALPLEIHQCLTRLAKREQSIDVSRISPKAQLYPEFERIASGYNQPCASYLAASLNTEFRTYHEARKNTTQDYRPLRGIEFENYLAQRLKNAGYSVAGTRATGDQGADLIAKRDGKTIAIQAKGYSGTVGNEAVQEIVGALRFYKADEGWVVTNSTFTPPARVLARANNVRLIDGNDLKRPLN